MSSSLSGCARPTGPFSLQPENGQVVLGAVGATLGVVLVARLVRPLALAVWRTHLAPTITRPLRRWVLGPVTIARRSGARGGQPVLLLGHVDAPVIRAFSEIVGPKGQVHAVPFNSPRAGDSRGPSDVERPRRNGPGRGEALPFADGSFDAVCTVSALGGAAVEVEKERLSEVWRVLRPAGRFSASELATDPSFRRLATVIRHGEAVGFECFERFGPALAYTVNFRKPLRASKG